MNDPWDVKSVQSSSQYVSCMKINGVPLLPPVLSKDCRKEMQYYILLAKEVETRIGILKKMADSDDSGTSTDTEITTPVESVTPHLDLHNASSTKTLIDSNENTPCASKDELLTRKNGTKSSMEKDIELPERDYNSKSSNDSKENEESTAQRLKISNEILNFTVSVSNEKCLPCDLTFNVERSPTRLNNKSFTGSLIDIHTENLKESQNRSPLTRQSSYTLLSPSPALMAHLKVCSIQTGVDVMSISMSDSLSQLSTSPCKKRRSWDLEAAKNSWSNMALELDNKKNATKNGSNINVFCTPSKTSTTPKSKYGVADRARSSNSSKSTLKSEPNPRPTRTPSKSNTTPASSTKKAVKKPAISPVNAKSNDSSRKSPGRSISTAGVCITPSSQKSLISDSEDPASKVKELYDKIKQQQKMQIANLIEKQKREQLLLQQVFEEQNSLFYNQLKNVCPKSPMEVRQAWSETDQKTGPVSLSQLINNKSSSPEVSPSTALSKYISQCDEVLRKSRDITDSLKKQNVNSSSCSPSKCRREESSSSSRGHSPVASFKSRRSHSITAPRRRINYESTSTERDIEPILTDRTNDTMADLNVTMPTDSCYDPCEDTVRQYCPTNNSHSDNRVNGTHCVAGLKRPSSRELVAATTIVAHAKGYLVRRLMRTERVQGIVQTIKDVLVCALQLHQDRQGIRGADVDLHRRLIQQITSACYSLHDTFVTSTPAERCALIATDRARRAALDARGTPPPRSGRHFVFRNGGGVAPNCVTPHDTYGQETNCSRSSSLPTERRC